MHSPRGYFQALGFLWPWDFEGRVPHILLHKGMAFLPSSRQTSVPAGGTFDFNIIQQPDLFRRQKGKWTEVPYVQTSFVLWDNPDLYKFYKIDPVLLVVMAGKSTGNRSTEIKQVPEEQSERAIECPNPFSPPPIVTSTLLAPPSQLLPILPCFALTFAGNV